MMRALLVLSLFLFAASAFAVEPAQAEPDASGCPKSEAARGKPPTEEGQATPTRPGNTAPVRARSSGTVRGTPRWHSLLPGMFR